jgi:hypothetical protein
MAKGKRLTCPLCQDSSFFTLEQLASVGGRVQCGNHLAPIEMVDLLGLFEIFGRGEPVPEEFEEEFEAAVDHGLLHPDDFEFEEVDFG